LYLVQEFIEGQNLLQELQQQGTFNEAKIIQLLTDLLPVLQFIHERGVIHRDIKPENIMRRQHDGKLMLIDFGVSKQAIGTIISQVGTTVGTPGYAPLEQMRGQVFPASDLYSLGVTCIRLLTGCLPRLDGFDELYNAQTGDWKWREHVSKHKNINHQLGQVLDKLVNDYVKERYQTANEVIQIFNCSHLENKVFDKVKTIISVYLDVPVDKVIGTFCLSNSRADALDILEMIMELEEEFKIKISDEDSRNFFKLNFKSISSTNNFSTNSGGTGLKYSWEHYDLTVNDIVNYITKKIKNL
jgi:acyl carrier protein